MSDDAPKKVRDPHARRIGATFQEAINIVDETEPLIRHIIESELMDVAGFNKTKVGEAGLAADAVTKKIMAIRAKALKRAFRHLRDNLPSGL